MKIAKTFQELQVCVNDLKPTIGFVPTMGYLHQGHLSLVSRAREENQSVVVSIFINPTQFAPHEDFENYPRDIKGDMKLLENEKVDLIWLPEREEMYPMGFQTWVEVDNLTTKIEGNYRPTHFKGVTTIVAKLFNGVQPDRAYFGQKDAQQAIVIQQMVKDLNYPIEIVVCPIVREPDGLAMSSRNIHLDEYQRQAALCLYRGLSSAFQLFDQGERNADSLREVVEAEIMKEDLARMQYVSCADTSTLEELEGPVVSCLLSTAVFIGPVRLIDNIMLTDPDHL